ncbi:MAG TPA: ABC transporter ATP-binding protein [Pyrinomonadaceae bacterium]|nr:ABC transporter ATP-binding protein [Pyrinomonadaceae bacterium]
MADGGIKITRLLRPYWASLALASAAVAVEGATDLLEPWPLKIVFDYVIGSKQMTGRLAAVVGGTTGTDKSAVLEFSVLAVIAIALAAAVGTYAEKYLTTSVGQHVMHDLRHLLYHHIQRLSLSYYEKQKTGDLIVRVTSDIDAVQDFVSSALLGVAVDVLTLLGMLGVMFYLDWRFTLVALSVAPVLFAVVYTFTRRIKRAAREVKKKESEITSVVQESLTSVRVVKAFAREEYEERRLDKESLESVDMALRARKVKAKLSPAVDIIVAAGTALVLWFGVKFVLTGELTAGALIVFILYLGKMYKPMRDLSKMTDTISKAQVGFERIREVLDTESKVRDLPGARTAPRFAGRIEFEHVRFGYEADRPVFTDLSLAVEPGQFVALVGPTGSGKSTLIGLIPRFYDPDAGRVKIDGADVRSYKLKSLRQQVSFVLQETLLFRAPVWQNIAYGKPEATREEIVRAAKLANAHEFIERMPQGYDTIIGERGETLSGGQRQRIAIARAIIRDTPILLLDEPSTGLDAASEELVFEALGYLMSGKTSIVIAHRLETVRRADVILVVADGAIIERGTHEELLARGGLYSHLYEIQFRRQAAQTGAQAIN